MGFVEKRLVICCNFVFLFSFVRGQVCIASRGKVKKLCIEVISSENTTIAVVFYRALEIQGRVLEKS